MNKHMKRRLWGLLICSISVGAFATFCGINLINWNEQFIVFWGILTLSAGSTAGLIFSVLLKGNEYDKSI